MTYPNAYKGVKKIYSANILSLIYSVLSILTAILLFSNRSTDLGLLSVVVVISGILAIVALILELVGICQAVRDESTFASARTAVIISLILSLISAFLEDSSLFHTLLEFAAKIATLCCNLFIITGIMELAAKLQNSAMVEEGRKLRKLILGIFFAGIVLELIVAILSFSKAGLVIALLLSVAVLIAAIVELVMFLSYLSKAVKMLNGGHSSSEQW